MNRAAIVEMHCVNTDKEELKCDGKCHLKKKISIIDNISESDQHRSTAVVYSHFELPVFFWDTSWSGKINCIAFQSIRQFQYLSLKNLFIGDCLTPPPRP